MELKSCWGTSPSSPVKNMPANAEGRCSVPGLGRCHRATKPVCHNYCAHAPQLLKPEGATAHAPQLKKLLRGEA